MFLAGIYKESLVLTHIFLLAASLAALLGLWKSLSSDAKFWINTIWLACTALMTLLYLLDLKQIDDENQSCDNNRRSLEQESEFL